jgi:hypothetical protein
MVMVNLFLPLPYFSLRSLSSSGRSETTFFWEAGVSVPLALLVAAPAAGAGSPRATPPSSAAEPPAALPSTRRCGPRLPFILA